ncbi:hypothetical protein C491_16917 [Natronococcus amylolyticus DSM 10524]|uniref:DUF7344 domain-containing protein n=1 Tax=Natronococcus amylolyticus DSM 10524 TaxID=1227497 RepID=L9X118_9EURY|nr:hypothetical protein [Natronococcus amylolyticus]ELY55415.1 hypothetical protein C491_16917 [Natronococcus amylolyticus DSM 10524]
MVDDPTRDDDVQSGSESVGAERDLPSREILELDHVYEALGHSRRRYLCYTLLERAEWSLTDLATKIAAWENGVPEHAVTGLQRERVYVALYHTHVPKLADDDVVTLDESTETIVAAENATQVLAALEGMGTTLDSNQETHARGEMDNDKQR